MYEKQHGQISDCVVMPPHMTVGATVCVCMCVRYSMCESVHAYVCLRLWAHVGRVLERVLVVGV